MLKVNAIHIDGRLLARWSVGFVLIFTLALWAGQQVQREDFMPIKQLQIQGKFKQVEVDELKRRIVANIDGNFFTLDMKSLHENVVTMPWVRAAWIDRVWPDLLRVRVKEQSPVAIWNGASLLNDGGDVFINANQVSKLSLPELEGPAGAEKKMLAQYRDFRDALAPLEMSVIKLKVDQRLSWFLTVDNGMKIALGRENAAQRLSRFINVYAKYFQKKTQQPEYVDLRYANGFSIDWRESHSLLMTPQRQSKAV